MLKIGGFVFIENKGELEVTTTIIDPGRIKECLVSTSGKV
jgi:hypothetical protein